MLYPLKFKPLLKERIWGGSVLIDKEVWRELGSLVC